MTKKEMMDKMIALGIYSENDRNYVLKRVSKKDMENDFKRLVPIRTEYLKKNQ